MNAFAGGCDNIMAIGGLNEIRKDCYYSRRMGKRREYSTVFRKRILGSGEWIGLISDEAI